MAADIAAKDVFEDLLPNNLEKVDFLVLNFNPFQVLFFFCSLFFSFTTLPPTQFPLHPSETSYFLSRSVASGREYKHRHTQYAYKRSNTDTHIGTGKSPGLVSTTVRKQSMVDLLFTNLQPHFLAQIIISIIQILDIFSHSLSMFPIIVSNSSNPK